MAHPLKGFSMKFFAQLTVSTNMTNVRQSLVEAIDSGALISVPVGTPTLGHIFNIIGEPADEQGEVAFEETLPNSS